MRSCIGSGDGHVYRADSRGNPRAMETTESAFVRLSCGVFNMMVSGLLIFA